jgi:hypothetical protein
MHGSRSKIPSKKFLPYIYEVKFLALLGAPYIYDISRLRVKMSVLKDSSYNALNTLLISIKTSKLILIRGKQ